jgi:tetratricopeptide (TPR) repeat protein
LSEETPVQEHVNIPSETVETKAAPVIRFDRGVATAQVWMSAFLIVVAGVIAYSNISAIPFHATDKALILDNTALRAFSTSLDVTRDPGMSVTSVLSYALNMKLAPNSAMGFHILNLILHIACGVLTFLVCRGLLGEVVSPVIPMLAGLLFVLHPLNSEIVDGLTSRSNQFCAFFTLLSVWSFLRAVRSKAEAEDASPNLALLSISGLAFVFAWASNEAAAYTPLLILGADWIANGRKLLRRLPAHFGLWGVLCVLFAVGEASGWNGMSLTGKSGSFAVLSSLAIVPTKLSVAHSVVPGSIIGTGVFCALTLIGVLLVLMRSPAGLGLLWFSLGLWLMAGGEASERDAYLGVAGLVFLAPWILTLLKPPPLRAAVGLLAACCVFAGGAATYMRNGVWIQETSLWEDAVAKAPDNAVALRNLGRAYINFADAAGKRAQTPEMYRAAEETLRESVSKNVRDVKAQTDLAIAVARQGRRDEALPLFLDVLRLDAANRFATVNMALLLDSMSTASGDEELLNRSIDYFRRADVLEPLTGDSLARYGAALFARGDFEAAEDALRRAVGNDSASPVAPLLKNVQDALKAVRSMEQQSRAAFAQDPDDLVGLKAKAQGLALRGRSLDADYVLEGIWRENRQDFPTWILSAFVKAKLGAAETFARSYAPPSKPAEVASVWKEAARACAARGLWEPAKIYLETQGAKDEGVDAPLVALADVAKELRQESRARDFLEQAVKANPNDPKPMLGLFDLVISSDPRAAAGFLAEAEKRGADAPSLASRKEKLGSAGINPSEPERTMIR